MASQRTRARGHIEEGSKREQRAERILDAAAELMLRWGYNNTTIDDIARLAGVAKSDADDGQCHPRAAAALRRCGDPCLRLRDHDRSPVP